jgi:hypothetical protein
VSERREIQVSESVIVRRSDYSATVTITDIMDNETIVVSVDEVDKLIMALDELKVVQNDDSYV